METKVCFKCGVEKVIIDFYVHRQMGDGHLNKCKECTKRDVKKHGEILNINPEYREKERLRSKEKYYRLNYKEKQREYNFLKPYKNGIKNIHRNLKLTKDQNVHHWNYNSLNDVIILDKKFHRFIHKYLILDDSLLIFKTVDGRLLKHKAEHIFYIEKIKNLFYK